MSSLDVGAEEPIEVSSAKISTVVFCPITPTGRSLMKTRKRMGKSTKPWGHRASRVEIRIVCLDICSLFPPKRYDNISPVALGSSYKCVTFH